MSKATTIGFMSLFALVLMLTGGLIINLHNNFKDGVVLAGDVSTSCQFHFIVGITAIITGVVCVVYTVQTIRTSSFPNAVSQGYSTLKQVLEKGQ